MDRERGRERERVRNRDTERESVSVWDCYTLGRFARGRVCGKTKHTTVEVRNCVKHIDPYRSKRLFGPG